MAKRARRPGYDVFVSSGGVPVVVTGDVTLGECKDAIEASGSIASGEEVTIAPRAGSASSEKYVKT